MNVLILRFLLHLCRPRPLIHMNQFKLLALCLAICACSANEEYRTHTPAIRKKMPPPFS